jgi:Leucyl aminopeptidase
MEDMKADMAGGAGTLHGIGAVAALGLPVRAIAVLAAAENLPGGDAFRPGDILRAANGKTIEIINTDAEGRLVLADALWYARREGATHVIDLATLTGAMSLALGDLTPASSRTTTTGATASRPPARAAATSSGSSRCTRAIAATSTRTSPT